MKCPECKSEHATKKGRAVTRKGKKQRFQCQECGKTFYDKEAEKE